MSKTNSTNSNSIKLLKPVVKRMYIDDGRSVPEIAKELNLNQKSVYNYVNANDKQWIKERDALSKKSANAPEILKSAIETLIEKANNLAVADGDPDVLANAIAKIGDSISKIQKVANSLKKDQDRLESVLFVIKDFGGYFHDQLKLKIYPSDFTDNFDLLLQGYQTYAINKFAK